VVITSVVISVSIRVPTPIVTASAQVRTSFYLMSSHRVSVEVFLDVDSNFSMGYSTSDLPVVYYLTGCGVFRPVDILKVHTAVSEVGLTLEILKLASVNDSGPVSYEHVLGG
jgi:hypothetical protein